MLLPALPVYADNTEGTTEATTENSIAAQERKKGEEAAAKQRKGSDGSWCGIYCTQSSMGYGGGCTGLSVTLMLQNSGTLKSDIQLADGIYKDTSDKKWQAYHKAVTSTYTLFTSDDYYLSGYASDLSGGFDDEFCTSSWSNPSSVKFKDESTLDGDVIYKVNGKYIDELSDTELIQALQMLWNNDYYIILGVRYGEKKVPNADAGVSGDGSDNTNSRHWVFLSGVTNDDFYMNDPALGHNLSWSESKQKPQSNTNVKDWSEYHRPVHIVIWKNEKTSARSRSGNYVNITDAGDEGKASMTEDGSNELGYSSDVFLGNGYYSEEQLFSKMEVSEMQIVDFGNFEDLGQDDRDALDNWKMNVEKEKEKNSINAWIRRIVMIFGILITIWSLLIYIAYWFDRLNNLIDFSLLEILTFQRLSLSDTEETCTFSLRHLGEKKRTVNHRAIILISVIGITFGALLISGILYRIIFIIVQKVLNLLYG